MKQVPLYVLAGGHSRRFGSDKARALVGTRPLIRVAIDPFETLASSVTVVARQPDEYIDLGLETVGDALLDRGPLGGLHRALQHLHESDQEWLLLGSCDLVGLRCAWVAALLDHRDAGGLTVAYRWRRWQPFPALYHRELLDAATDRLQRGQRSLWRLIEAAPHVALPLPAGWDRVVQVNAPADLERVAALTLR